MGGVTGQKHVPLAQTGRHTLMRAVEVAEEHEPAFSIHGVQRVAGELDPTVFKRFADAWREIGLPD